MNDIAPIFTSVPLPIRLQDTVPLGTVVTTVVASDSDGTVSLFSADSNVFVDHSMCTIFKSVFLRPQAVRYVMKSAGKKRHLPTS